MTGGFQFLIVQLKAMVAEPINVDNKFQFLIVQLKGYSSLNFLYLVTVSIPYSTIKSSTKTAIDYIREVSIPYSTIKR